MSGDLESRIVLESGLVLQLVAAWLDRVRRARGLAATPTGTWAALTAAEGAASPWPSPVTSPRRRTPADRAWWRLVQLRNHFAAEDRLARLALVMAAAEGRRPADTAESAELLRGLAAIVRLLQQPGRVAAIAAIPTTPPTSRA